MRRKLVGLCIVYMAAVPAVASGQERSQIRVGAGLNATDALQLSGHQVQIEISALLRSWLSLRGMGFLSFDGHFSEGRSLTEGLDFAAVLTSHTLPGRPYFGGGLGYTHTSLSAIKPFRHDLGLGTVMGLELGDRGWFVEARVRYFGNLFMERASTRSLHMVTVGRRW